MPFVGIGLHVLVAIIFAIHVLRTGQPIYWLFILFSFPLLGSVVYFIVIYLPSSRLDRGARKVVSVAARVMDPGRELREARSAFEYTPTAQNQMRLAAALLEAGQAEEAATNYEACLKGPFAADPEIRFGAARAFLECGRDEQAMAHLIAIRSADPAFRAEQLSLMLARAYAGAGRNAEAKTEFESAYRRFGSIEVRLEYAIWAVSSGDRTTADSLDQDITREMTRWNRHTHDLHAPLLKRLEEARARHQ